MAASRPREASSEKRPRGRPRSTDGSSPVQFRLPNQILDCYRRVSERTGLTLPEIFRRVIILYAPPAYATPPDPAAMHTPSERRSARSHYLRR